MPLGKVGSRGLGLLGGLNSVASTKDQFHPVPPLNTIVNENYGPFNLDAFILTDDGQYMSEGDTITTETY